MKQWMLSLFVGRAHARMAPTPAADAARTESAELIPGSAEQRTHERGEDARARSKTRGAPARQGARAKSQSSVDASSARHGATRHQFIGTGGPPRAVLGVQVDHAGDKKGARVLQRESRWSGGRSGLATATSSSRSTA